MILINTLHSTLRIINRMDTHYLGFKMIDEDISDDKRHSIFLSLKVLPNHRKSLVEFFMKYDERM